MEVSTTDEANGTSTVQLEKDIMELVCAGMNMETTGNFIAAVEKYQASLRGIQKLLVLTEDPTLVEKLQKTKLDVMERIEALTAVREQIEVLFHIPDGVQMYVVDGETVSAPQYPTFLQLCRNTETNCCYLCVGDWSYPLLPGKASPVLESSQGVLMLPDLSNPVAGRSVGVIFPESVPLEKRQELMKRLQELTAFQDYRGTSSIERSASAISAGILRGATAASATITQLANHYVARRASDASGAVDAFPPPGSALPPGTVPTSMATGFRVARTGGKGLMKLTGWMVQGVGYATQQLATWAAPKVERTGSQILSRATGLNEGQVKEKMGSGMEYIGQAVAGFGTVYMGLEQGARVIAKGLRDGSVVIVESKYGPHAGEVAGNALDTAGFVGMAAYNVQALGPKGIAKRAAKDIGKQVVTNQGKGKGGAPPVPPPPRPQ